jgi:hypothetical protein
MDEKNWGEILLEKCQERYFIREKDVLEGLPIELHGEWNSFVKDWIEPKNKGQRPSLKDKNNAFYSWDVGVFLGFKRHLYDEKMKKVYNEWKYEKH